jgi:pimeloyl-ACP methyl ester carboxylesterase
MPTIAVNGTQLYYELSGVGDVPVVLVHGSWIDHHNWDPVVPLFARSFRVLTYDRRGHSLSAPVATQGSMREDAGDLAALLEALGLAPAHVVGNSFGASIALRLATERPELFRSLVVQEPPLFALLAADPEARGALPELGRRAAAVAELLRAGELAEGAKQFVETMAFGPGMWDKLPEDVRRTFVANALTFLDEGRDPEWATIDLAALGRFPHPVLLTHGDQSPPLFRAVVAQIARALPSAAQHVFVGAGHAPHLTQPEVYADVVGEFVTETANA